MDAVSFGILGRTALRVAGKIDESWGKPRERQLLAALLVHAGRQVKIETLIEWAWPEETAPARSLVSDFHAYATRIRKALRRVEVPADLVAKEGGYLLDVDGSQVDYLLFREFMAKVHVLLRQERTLDAVTQAERALALWRGPPLDDLRSDHARNWRRRVVSDEWLPANATLLDAMLELGRYETVLAQVDDLLAEYPDDLTLTRIRRRALQGLAHYDEAVAYYLTARRRLVRESDLGAEHIRQFQESLVAAKQLPPAGLTVSQVRDNVEAPRQLPHDIPEFVGRADLLRALDLAATNASGEPRGGVIVLDGMAGVGKTTLAVHWGHLSRHRFPDGDLFVNLNGFSDRAPVTPARVVDDFLIALGRQPDMSLDQRSKESLLNRLLGHRRVLVILDNAGNAGHIEELIALLPSCLIIVTSRHRLTLLSATTGAHRVRVEPMPVTEADELLSTRLGPQRSFDQDDRARLVRLCGGLPIAISVLADHVATSGIGRPAAFARQLDRRQLIIDIGEDGDGSAIAFTFFLWSYQRLGPEERRLFRLLGLHPGPDIGIDVACACDGRTPAETRHSFGILVNAHLLERPDLGENRYRFHDLMHEFAAYRAELDEPPESRRAAQRRILDFYLRSAATADRVLYPNRITPPDLPAEDGVEPLAFDTRAQAQTWFNQERTNLTATVAMANAHGHHDHAWRLADVVVIFFDRHGYHGDSREVLRFAVISAQTAGHRDGELSSLEALGKVHMMLGAHAEAQRCLDLALDRATTDRNDQALATTLHLLGRLQACRGDTSGAIEHFQRCLEVAQLIDDHRNQCWAHARIGELLRALGQIDQALVHLHKVDHLARQLGDQSALAASLATIGSVLRDRGDHHMARAHAERALQIAEAIPDRTIVVQASTALAEINAALGDTAAAIRYGQYALEVCGTMPDEAHAHEVLGNVRYSFGAVPEALVGWTRAADLYESAGNATRAALLRAKITGPTRGQ